MKIRDGYVSNSSTSSFIATPTGEYSDNLQGDTSMGSSIYNSAEWDKISYYQNELQWNAPLEDQVKVERNEPKNTLIVYTPKITDFDEEINTIYNSLYNKVNSLWYKIVKRIFNRSITLREQYILDILTSAKSIIKYLPTEKVENFIINVSNVVRYILNKDHKYRISIVGDIEYMLKTIDTYCQRKQEGEVNELFDILDVSLSKIDRNVDAEHDFEIIRKTAKVMQNLGV